jgi:glutathione S-transferase
MTESAAICQYLVSRYGPSPLGVEPTESDFGPYLNWLHFGEATLTFPQTVVLRNSLFAPPERRSEDVAADYKRWFLSRLRGIDAVVSKQSTLCGSRFTIADISVGFALLLAQFIGLDAKFTPAVAAYWQSLKGRSGFKKAVAKQDAAGREQGVENRLGRLA